MIALPITVCHVNGNPGWYISYGMSSSVYCTVKIFSTQQSVLLLLLKHINESFLVYASSII